MTRRKRNVLSDINDPQKNTGCIEGFAGLFLIGVILMGTMWWNEVYPFGPNDIPEFATTDEKTGVDEEFPNIIGNTPTPPPTRDFGPTIPSNAEAEPTSIYPLTLEKCNEMYAAGHWNDGIQARCDRVYEARVEEDELFMQAAVAATVNAMSYATAQTEPHISDDQYRGYASSPPQTYTIIAHAGRIVYQPTPPAPVIPPAGYARAQLSPPPIGRLVQSTKSGWERALDETCGTFFSLDPRGYAGAGSLYGDPTRGCHR